MHKDIKVSFTKEDYRKELNRFYQEQKENLYVSSSKQIEMNRMKDTIYDAFEYVGEESPDLDKFTYEQLRSAIRKANEDMAKTYKEHGDSNKFYERVIYHLMGNGDAETE